MKTSILILVHLFCAGILVSFAFSDEPQTKLKGEWKAKNGAHLVINDDQFLLEQNNLLANDYFIQQDTIFAASANEGSYSKYIVKKLDDHQLQLISPDSQLIDFSR